jgi:maleate cis-trans isomerase
VSICSITSNVEHWNNENFKQAVIDPLVTLSKYLGSRDVHYIMHCGMPVVTLRGKGFEEEIVKIISDASGVPASTSIRSAIRALDHLGIRNVAVVSPYPPELHQSALTFLKASGFAIAADHTEDVVFKRLQDVTAAHIAAVAKRVLAAAPKADGVYIPCNQWAAADAVPIIETECGLPAVSGAHADHWEAFRVLGIHDPLPGNGRLMESLRNGAAAPAAASARG